MRHSLAFFIIGLLAAADASATHTWSGTTPSGATYNIAVPDGWKAGGPLVLYQHGFTFDTTPSNPDLGPLANLQLSEGYAVAATSYSQRAWALFRGPDDNRQLVDAFTKKFGAPGEIVPFGGSLGGLMSLKLAEDPVLKPKIKGVYALCPPAAGARVWDEAIDLRLAYDVVCKDAGELPTGSQPYPWAYDLWQIPDHLSDLFDQARLLTTLVPLNQCTGVNLNQVLRNGAMERRLTSLKTVSGLSDDDFFVTNVGYATYGISDLVRAPDKLDGANAFGNVGVDYGDATINASIARITPDSMGRLRMHWYSDFRGDVGGIKVLSLNTSGDQLVIPANQDALRHALPEGQLVSTLVSESEPSHCGFTDAEGAAGWEALRAWKDGADKPAVSDLQARCELLSGGAANKCRFDANLPVPSFDSKVRPRNVAGPAIDAHYSGNWFDPARSGEGLALEVLDANTAVGYFFTYPPAGRTTAQQVWVYGVGRITPQGIAFDDVRETYTADAQPGFEPSEIAYPPGAPRQGRWGRLFVSFDDCSNGQLRWEGPPGWGAKTVPLQRLTALDGLACNQAAPTGPQASGSWFDPAYYGTGFHVERLDADHTLVMLFAPLGTPVIQGWQIGIATGDVAQGVDVSLMQSYGPHFGDEYGAVALEQRELAKAHVQLGCSTGTVQLHGVDDHRTYDTTLHLQRATTPAGVAACQ